MSVVFPVLLLAASLSGCALFGFPAQVAIQPSATAAPSPPLGPALPPSGTAAPASAVRAEPTSATSVPAPSVIPEAPTPANSPPSTSVTPEVPTPEKPPSHPVVRAVSTPATPPLTPPSVIPEVPTPERPPPPLPVITPRVPDERQVAQEILTRVSHAWRTVDQIDQSRLARDQREIFSIIQDFLTKAREALSTKDLPRAQILADKASKLAEDLAASVRRTP